MNSKSTNPLMNKDSERGGNTMEIMMGLVLPIFVVIVTFASKKYEQKKQAEMHDQIMKKAAAELIDYVRKSLPQG